MTPHKTKLNSSKNQVSSPFHFRKPSHSLSYCIYRQKKIYLYLLGNVRFGLWQIKWDLIFHQIVTILTLHMIIPRFLAEAVFRLLINRQKHFKTLWGRRNIMTFWISLCRIPQDKHSLRICFYIFCKVSTISKLEKRSVLL